MNTWDPNRFGKQDLSKNELVRREANYEQSLTTTVCAQRLILDILGYTSEGLEYDHPVRSDPIFEGYGVFQTMHQILPVVTLASESRC